MENPGPVGLTGANGVDGPIGGAGLSGLGADLKGCQYYENPNRREIKQGESLPTRLVVSRTIQEVGL